MRAVQITRFGGPEVLDVVDLPDPVPGPDQQLYEVSSAGVNFADTHQTENSYLSAQELPLIPGTEFVGRAGDGPRVVGLAPTGGYAQKVVTSPRLTWPVGAPPALTWRGGGSDWQRLAVIGVDLAVDSRESRRRSCTALPSIREARERKIA